MKSLHHWLARPTDSASLATFRIFFGLIMVWEVWRYFHYDRIARYYIEPTFFFPYEFFWFLTPLPGEGMIYLFVILGLLALCIALGFFYRPAAGLFFLGYTYIFLLDKTQYNNHYYLISLLAFLLFISDANRWASLDRWRAKAAMPTEIPYWQLCLFQAQIVIVYFYGGLAKINSDWLAGEPMRTWLLNRSHYPVLGPFFATEWAAYFFSYGGLLFDLSIGFLLLWRPTRLLAFLAVLFFNLTNNWLFSIGIFPFMMIAATTLFVEPDWPHRVSRFFRQDETGSTACPANRLQPRTFLPLGFVALYLAVQLLVPLRHWFYPGEVSWTEEGHRFAWHMKLRSKSAAVRLTVTDPATGQHWEVDLQQDLNDRQIDKMASRPDMIRQYAQFLKTKWQAAGVSQPVIKAEVWASLNGRPAQWLIDPETDLAQVTYQPLAAADWIIPLSEPALP